MKSSSNENKYGYSPNFCLNQAKKSSEEVILSFTNLLDCMESVGCKGINTCWNDSFYLMGMCSDEYNACKNK